MLYTMQLWKLLIAHFEPVSAVGIMVSGIMLGGWYYVWGDQSLRFRQEELYSVDHLSVI